MILSTIIYACHGCEWWADQVRSTRILWLKNIPLKGDFQCTLSRSRVWLRGHPLNWLGIATAKRVKSKTSVTFSLSHTPSLQLLLLSSCSACWLFYRRCVPQSLSCPHLIHVQPCRSKSRWLPLIGRGYRSNTLCWLGSMGWFCMRDVRLCFLCVARGCWSWLGVVGRSGRCAGAVIEHLRLLQHWNGDRFDCVASRTPRKSLYHYWEQ